MRTPAKTNLFLSVVGKRPDGYHDLENVFVPLADLYDEVILEPNPQTTEATMTIDSPWGLQPDRGNLCLKAAAAFAAATGMPFHGNIHLKKRIPIAAGLGGGSSDAAAVLRLLNDHAGTPLDAAAMQAIASSLGADVPFFLNPEPALGVERGDVLTPIALNASCAVIVVTPLFPLPVAWTFSHRVPASTDAPTLQEFLHAAESGDAHALAATMRNDLETAVFVKFPLLDMMRDELLHDGALAVHVSGSGPSLVALSEPDKANAIADAFHQAFATIPRPAVTVFNPIRR